MAMGKRAVPPERDSLNDVFEAEQKLVGLMLTDPAAYGRIAAILRGEDWTQHLHRGVFEAVGRLVEEGRTVSPISVFPKVGDVAPDGGPADRYLLALVAGAPSSAFVEALAHRLADAAHARSGSDHLDGDLYAWAYAQALALRRGQFSALDALNLAEEIEDLGAAIYRQMESALRLTLMHLLKWDYQPEKRTRSWHLSIRNERLDVEELMERYPSLKHRLPGAIDRAYRRARLDAAGETGLDETAFPAACPYSYETLMTRPIPWPVET